MRTCRWIFIFASIFLSDFAIAQQTVDICIYGATSGGVIAAYTAAKSGKSVLLIEPGNHVGGLSSGGLGYTDIGNKYAITGLARDFYRRVGAHYGKFEQWIFEPHVAEQIFLDYLNRAHVKVLYGHSLSSVKKKENIIDFIIVKKSDNTHNPGSQTIKAKIFIDCSYEGDLMAKAGVPYFTGREANSLLNETYNGVQLRDKHQFLDGVDPYIIPGKPESGLLWGISSETVQPDGSGDNKIQAYNFRLCLSNDPKNRISISKPDHYEPAHYELLLRCLNKNPASPFLNINLMPNHKTDINNNGPFSTDMIGMNYNYPDADYATRKKIQKEHEEYIKGLLYFIGHDERMPPNLREEMLQWGYPKDEYADNDHWSPQMYVREARRMNGEYVMTQANCEGRDVVTDGIGMAAYTMDSHNCQRIVVNGMVKNEGDVQKGGFGPYPVSYRSIVPKEDDCANLLVPVCLSATHIAYGSIRMEPVFMVLSQSAAIAASLAIDQHLSIQKIDTKKLHTLLLQNPLADNSTAEILVDDIDSLHVKISGEWKREHSNCYGPSMLKSDGRSDENNSVRFMPTIKKAGTYNVYAYMPKVENGASVTSIIVYDGKVKKTLTIRDKEIHVEGQTSGEWIALGTYNLPTGKQAYAEISCKGSDGIVLADAVLFVPEFK